MGGTRILAPAVSRLDALGWRVDVVTRDPAWFPPAGSQIGRIVTDATDPPRWDAALSRHAPPAGWDLALAYMPFADGPAWRSLAERVRGRLVAVLTSTVADPDRTVAPLPPMPGPAAVVTLVLGWHQDRDGVRWHDPEEISAAAVRVALADPAQDCVSATHPLPAVVDLPPCVLLGVVRPWRQRPAAG